MCGLILLDISCRSCIVHNCRIFRFLSIWFLKFFSDFGGIKPQTLISHKYKNHHSSPDLLEGLDVLRGYWNLLQQTHIQHTWFHHFPIGHLAFARVVFKCIKQPHLVQRTCFFDRYGHSIQIASLASLSSSSDLGWFGLNRSINLTSSLIYPF